MNNAAPSVQLHYRAFIPNTSCSVPVRHIGTLILAVLAACDFSLCIGAQVLTFRTKAWLSFAPPPCRMPLGPSQASPKLIPVSYTHLDVYKRQVPGTAVFLTRTEHDAPPVMVWHLKHNRALHENVFVLTVLIEAVPWIDDARRLTFQEIAPRFWRAVARYGFMERPDIPALLQTAHALSLIHI